MSNTLPANSNSFFILFPTFQLIIKKLMMKKFLMDHFMATITILRIYSGQESVSDKILKELLLMLPNLIKLHGIKQEQYHFYNYYQTKIDDLTKHTVYDIFMTLFTIFVLFADDIRILATDQNGDKYFYVFVLICFFFFLIEILLLIIVRPGYICSFFFWMDFISTISIVMEIPWVIEDVLHLGFLSDSTTIAKAGRASRVSSRATRLLRIIRLIRFVRISKLYKHAQKQIDQKFKGQQQLNQQNWETQNSKPNHQGSPPFTEQLSQPQLTQKSFAVDNLIQKSRRSSSRRRSTILSGTVNQQLKSSGQRRSSRFGLGNDQVKNLEVQEPIEAIKEQQEDEIRESDDMMEDDIDYFYDEINEEEAPQETTVGKKLSDLTTKRSITLMLSVIMAFPLFQYETYWDNTISLDTGIIFLHNGYADNGQFFIDEFLKYHEGGRFEILEIQLHDNLFQKTYKDVHYRNEEMEMYEYSSSSVTVLTKQDNDLQAILNILRTIFVVLTLVIGVILFAQDSNDLVVIPIENMLSQVKKISKNPLQAAFLEEDQMVYEEELLNSQNKEEIKKHLESNAYETVILEKLIIKTGALLAIGFGEAGSRIIAENMNQGDAVNPLIPGKKVMAIFGFCDIRQFTNITEVLEEKVMIFVNEIANIVHTEVQNHHGAANKNIGDAFLLVWKIPSLAMDLNLIRDQKILGSFAELALLAFIKTMIRIQQSLAIEKYRQDELLCKEIPNFSVKLGYGLHIGWAIEGAIGSQFKIDASYLSPNVNMAARLETATKQYGVNILMSGPFYQVLSTAVQQHLRMIDRITVKGSIVPIDLFTFDMDLGVLGVKKIRNSTQQSKKVEKYFQRRKLNRHYDNVIRNRVKMSQIFDNDEAIKRTRNRYDKVLICNFHIFSLFLINLMQPLNFIYLGNGKDRVKFQTLLKMMAPQYVYFNI